MEYIEIENKHKQIIDLAKKYMESINDSEHDINHMNDVVGYTKELLNILDVKVNIDACIISAYWHDVGRTKANDGHEKLSAEMLKKVMLDLNYDETLINDCYVAIENHKWNMQPKSTEGLIIKDADKLAFLGEGRWESCLVNHQKLDELIKLLPKLRNEILYFDESKAIYDRDIVNLIKVLYDKCFITGEV